MHSEDSIAGAEELTLISDKFREIADELNRIIFSADDYFSVISSKVQAFYSASNQITADSYTFTGLLSSKRYLDGIHNLKRSLLKISDLINLSGNNLASSEGSLTKVVNWLCEIREDVLGFRKLVRHLEVQAVSIKIESARPGNDLSGFANLAESINNLAGIISGKSSAFKVKSIELQETIEKAKAQINNLIGYHNQNKGLIENKTRHAINTLVEKYQSSADKAEIISEDIGTIYKEISALVTAVQFHDITRQQVTNVIGVIGELRENINSFYKGINSKKEASALVYYINHACQTPGGSSCKLKE